MVRARGLTLETVRLEQQGGNDFLNCETDDLDKDRSPRA